MMWGALKVSGWGWLGCGKLAGNSGAVLRFCDIFIVCERQKKHRPTKIMSQIEFNDAFKDVQASHFVPFVCL